MTTYVQVACAVYVLSALLLVRRRRQVTRRELNADDVVLCMVVATAAAVVWPIGIFIVVWLGFGDIIERDRLGRVINRRRP